MYPGKLSTDTWYQVLLLNSSGVAQTGKVVGDLTVKYHYEASTSQQTYSPSAGDWKEAGDGEYWLNIGAAEWYTVGNFQLSIACAGAVTHRIPIRVGKYFIEDIFQGNQVELQLQKVVVNNNYGTAAELTGSTDAFVASGTNGYGMNIYGKTTGIIVSSASHAARFIPGQDSHAISLEADGAGHGINATSTTGVGNGCGIYLQGNGTGHGLHSVSGPGATGNGIHAESAATNGKGIAANGNGTGAGLLCAGGVTGPDISATEIGTPVSLNGGAASLAGMLTKMADNNGGADFDASSDSLHEKTDPLITLMYGRQGVPIDLGDGATIAENLTSMAGKTGGAASFNRTYDSLEALSDAESDNLSLTDMKNLLFKRNVTARHPNDKPMTIEAGDGISAVVITTTLDGVATEQIKTEDYV